MKPSSRRRLAQNANIVGAQLAWLGVVLVQNGVLGR